ncbi:hypothetical protein DFJ58DRAFT_729016 [Suillus subalutaceus]|uniref:uncharacterized protein n=1 Tax=Suillus subalutaceus TaxID=48586 RepID=UPI001B8690B8|nr:uncharacterized protein DFJ58DRAFT_729016 [Suillus subalutaceus]KAG1851035.1 hypothetical protein DFJ58DRAFT_729016 [Suillus subalutaceus]
MTTEDITSNVPSKRGSSALRMGPRKKSPHLIHLSHTDDTSVEQLEQMEETPLEDFSADERQEHHVFEQLLDSYPGLLERLKNGSEEEILHVGELIGKGAAGARGNDTKTLKSTVLDWISPKGDTIQPHLHRNSKIDRGFNHELTGSLLCPAGMDWNNPEKTYGAARCRSAETNGPFFGLLRSQLLAYRHIFTSPSSVEKEPKATRSRNAHLHGMNCVTITSISYIATQVRFAISSSSVLSRTNTTTDSETFYHSLLDLLEDPAECKEVDRLLTWWNWQVFPTLSAAK